MAKHRVGVVEPEGLSIEVVADRKVVVVSWIEEGKETKVEFPLASWVIMTRAVEVDIVETFPPDDESSHS